ncbi:MAG: glutathione S-transferase family protein [Rhodospirillaceae bacterium]|nr:glutathione S-transferase family protein [Rhodospirillaceae bacterium]
MIELYQSYLSTCSGKVRLVLEEKGLDYSEIVINLQKGDQFEPEYVKLNPKNVVPTIIHDGKVVRESSVICEYLDDFAPEPSLRPADHWKRAQMRLWMKFIDEEVHPVTTIVTYAVAIRHERAAANTPEQLEAHFNKMTDAKKREQQRAIHHDGVDSPYFQDAIKIMDKMVANAEASLEEFGGPWLLGEDYSLADVVVTPYMLRLAHFSFDGMWQDNRPLVADWWERIQARPNYRGVISLNTPTANLEKRQARGAEEWPRVKEILGL